MLIIGKIDDCSRMVTEHEINSKGGYEALEALKIIPKHMESLQARLCANSTMELNLLSYISEMNTSRKKKASLSGFEQFLNFQHHD